MRGILKSIFGTLYLLLTSGCINNNAWIEYRNGVFKTSETSEFKIIKIEILAKQEINRLFEWNCKRDSQSCNAVSIRTVLDSLEERHDTLIVTLSTGLLINNQLKRLNDFRFVSLKNQKKDSLILLKPERY